MRSSEVPHRHDDRVSNEAMRMRSAPLPAAAPGIRPRRGPRSGARTRLLLVAALACGLPAKALQLIEASDGVAAEAIVSIKEPTRLRIEGAAITDVFGNIHTNHCSTGAPAAGAGAGVPPVSPLAAPGSPAPAPSNPAGDVIIACDRDKGEIYLRPVGDGMRPINLFVSSASATYTLLLRRADTPADTIVVRDKTPRALRPLAHAAPEPASSGPAPNHVRTMKALLVAMASDRIPPDIRVEDSHRPVQLWAQARLTLVRQYEGRGFIGEKYALENTSAAAMVLAEQEFDRPDRQAAGEITGIAIEHHNLRPGESTSIYVMRRGDPR